MVRRAKMAWSNTVTGNIIVLNGTSSAGKTTLAKSIQTLAEEPYQIFAFDQIRDGLPDRFRGLNSPQGSPGAAGLNVVAAPSNDSIRTFIELGEHALDVVRGMHQAVAAFAQTGQHVVVDHFVNQRAAALDLERAFEGIPTLIVQVICDADELQRRERLRPGRFPGTAETQRELMASCFKYDLTVDSTHTSANELARQVHEFVAAQH